MTNIARPVLKIIILHILVVGLMAAMFGLTIARETPAGTVVGQVFNERNQPIKRARISLSSEGTYRDTILGVTNEKGRFVITDVPEGKYTGYVSARGYESRELNDYKAFGIKEGKTTTIGKVQMIPREPSINGGLDSEFIPGSKVVISLDGYSRKPTTQLRLAIYRYDFAGQLRASGGRPIDDENSQTLRKKLGKAIYRRTITVHTDSEGYFDRNAILPIKDLGGYLVDVKLETTERLFKTLITDLALVTKRAPSKTLVYASSLTRKRPIEGVNLEFFADNAKLPTSGRTGPDGLFITGALPKESIRVLGSSGKSYAIGDSYGNEDNEAVRCYVYTDRPVYRPGHTVLFKGILRTSEPGRFLPVANQTVPVELDGPDGNTVKTLSVQTNSFGSFSGEFAIDSDAALGYYHISAIYKGEHYERMFSVDEYRKPEFKSSVGFTKPRFVSGSPVEARVEANYYFGGPVTGAIVKYTIYTSPSYFYFYPDEASDTSFYEDLYSSEGDGEEYYGGYGEVLLEGEGQTDQNGQLKLSIPTKHMGNDREYSVEASVTDATGRSIDVSGSVLVTSGEFLLSAINDEYIYQPKQVVKTRIYAVDYDRHPVPAVLASVSVYRLRDRDQHRGAVVTANDVQLDSKGQGEFFFAPPDNGSYEIVVRAKDKLGNSIEGSSQIYSYSKEWEGESYEAPALEITVDKKLYKVGDTARVMISSPTKDCYVLFTIEGRRLFEQRVIHLTSLSKIIEIPVTRDYAPNAYVCVSMVNGKNLATAEAPVPVSPEPNFLNVKIESNKQRYLPGETATYTITTTDCQGKGVPAEVSLGVVDESLYAIREDTTPDIKRFFHGPIENKVSTSVSFSEDYYGGEDKFQGKVRKYFPDTAYWNPNILTGSDGTASVSFKMPDNLTTWRATARAVTMGTAVGSAKQLVMVTKNILVRLQTPRFFRQRDEFTLSAVVHNYTERDQCVRVWLEAKGLRVDGDLSRTISIAKNDVARIEWNAQATEVGTATLTVYAQGQGDQDAMQMEAPVLPHGVPEIVSAGGQTKTSTQFALNVPGGIITDASELHLGFSPSIASAALGITDGLKDYRMDSPEGIMDVLLPNVVMYQAMRDLGAQSSQRYAEIQKMVKHDLRTVYKWQLPGGGWGWSEYGGKDAWMTAYVVYGLIRAKQAGLGVDEKVLKDGINATIESLPNVRDLGKRATVIYVLALAGRAKPEWTDSVLRDKRLQNYSLALMILSLTEMGKRDEASRLVPKLIRGATVTERHCSWPETFEWGFYSCNAYETTAYAIRALLAVDPENPCVAKGVRWLVDRRRGDRYNANYDTASVVYALAEYLRVYKPAAPDYTARVSVNGKMLREFSMDPSSMHQPELRIDAKGSIVRGGRNTIKIDKTGIGDLFYWASLKYYSAVEDVPELRGKISISREYFRLRLVKDPKEGLVYKPEPLGDIAEVGELIRCRLVLKSPKDFLYLTVNDMLPSGCEVVERNRQVNYDDGLVWDYWWGGETIHDDRITFMVDNVYKGKRVIEYDFRPEIKGSFHAMPATAQGLYEPEVYAHSSERRLIVK